MSTVSSTEGFVDESALADGSGGGSATDTGSFTITTDWWSTLATVEVQDKDGVFIDVTGGGTVTG